jgi:uncharacterized membrane protein YbhN (UPF0104 family)
MEPASDPVAPRSPRTEHAVAPRRPLPSDGSASKGATGRTAIRVLLFASAPGDPRARRPVDGLRVIASLLILFLAAVLSEVTNVDRELSERLASSPDVLEVLWRAAFWLAVGWSLTLLVATAVRDRLVVAAEALGAALLAGAIALLAATLVNGGAGAVVRHVFDSDGPPVFPPATPAMTSAVIATMAPFLTLPARRFGRVLIVLQMLGSPFLAVAHAFGAVASLAIGLAAGSTVHLVRGSPGGMPTVNRIRAALGELGVDAMHLASPVMRRDGVTVLSGTDQRGAIEVKVYGRDAWEGELAATMWRSVWYRGRQHGPRTSRADAVEHEGFMTYLAATAGARVPEVVTAGLADDGGDALIVVRPDGAPLVAASPVLGTSEARALWADLRRLHARGITHRRIDLDRIALHDDGTAGFGDVSSASVRSDAGDELADAAQLLALTTVTSGPEIAIAEARAALGDDGLLAVAPYLQAAALPPGVRMAIRRQHLDLDRVRGELVEQLGAPDIELAKIRRLTWKSALSLGLLATAAYTVIGMISGLDFDALGRALADARWWWLACALGIAQLARVANGLSTMGATQETLPFGPTTALQFATCYVNLAVPSAAGRVAITTRFYQRFGATAAAGLSAGFIDGFSETTIQIVLFVLLFFLSDTDLQLSFSTDQLSGVATIALIAVVVLLVAVAVALAVPSLRPKFVESARQARAAFAVLHSPRKIVQLYGGNLLVQILFAATLGACVRGFGYDLDFSTLLLINCVVSLFAGLLPVPGGVGVSEAGLALGLTRAGIPSETAFAIALAHRFATFYLPPIWGFFCYRWMTSREYL